MIRKFDNFYRRHPRVSLAGMILAAFVTLCMADKADRDNTAALRLQLLSVRGAT
ncbi:hypothetical protein [Paraburkholderia elongata]|uniref:Uncharacterized protein n=1 Tax=Paraburkholderia elongata TaxID=2675747 RepID=A0A972NVB0_9BURK|nr:hypothetical protein [Paraburkholderia elongata]NPT59044.1 hypothetical protein [Paraburkholderia elongata]